MAATLAEDKRDTTGFGSRLRSIREAAGVTQQQLADMVGMNYQNVGRLERGDRSPSWKTVLKLADALGVEPNDFLDKDGTDGDNAGEAGESPDPPASGDDTQPPKRPRKK